MSKYIDAKSLAPSMQDPRVPLTARRQFLLWDVQIWDSTPNKGGQLDFQHQKHVNQTLGH